MLLSLGAVIAAACAGCVTPAVDSDPDDVEETATSHDSLGVVSSNSGSPQQQQDPQGGPSAKSTSVLPGQDCEDPEPQPWRPDAAQSGDDGTDGDTNPDTVIRTMTILPSGGHHSS